MAVIIYGPPANRIILREGTVEFEYPIAVVLVIGVDRHALLERVPACMRHLLNSV